jgi:hypothetical protein
VTGDHVVVIRQASPSWVQEYKLREFKRDAHAKAAGLSKAEYIIAIESMLRGWVDHAEVRTRVDEVGLIGILRSKRFLSWAAVGTTRSGMKSPQQRIDTEQRLFDIGADAEPNARPVYGYLEGSREGDPLTRWGPIVLGLDDVVRKQATFVLGDSVDDTLITPAFIPVPLIQPTIDAVSLERRDTISAVGLADACGYGYAEVQLHGQVPATAIKRVIYTAGAAPGEEVLEQMSKIGLVPESVSGHDPGRRH